MKKFLAILAAWIFLIEVAAAAQLEPEYYAEPEYADDEIPPETTEPETSGEGLEFLVYDENGVMAFAVIAAHENYKLRPILARNQIQGRATLAQITKNLDDIAIINASYFMPTGSLIGVTKIDGEIIGRDEFYRSAIGITAGGAAVFGRVRYEGKIILNGVERGIDEVNWARTENSLILYNRYWGANTATNEFGVEILVRDGVIKKIFRGKGNMRIPRGGYVLSAHGAAAEFFANARVGDKITISQKIISDTGDFNDIPTVIGAGPRLVKDGKVCVTAAEEKFPSDIRSGRAPRSAVGVTIYGDYIFAVVDGRQAHSRGCTLEEWAKILIKFGAVDAINLDGGGSTELIVKDALVNRPSDGRERQIASAIAIMPK